MEKLAIGYQMSTNWTDPPIMLMSIIPYGLPAPRPRPIQPPACLKRKIFQTLVAGYPGWPRRRRALTFACVPSCLSESVATSCLTWHHPGA